MHSILEQCYNQFLSDFSESWLPDGEDENVLFDKKSQIDSFFCGVLYSIEQIYY